MCFEMSGFQLAGRPVTHRPPPLTLIYHLFLTRQHTDTTRQVVICDQVEEWTLRRALLCRLYCYREQHNINQEERVHFPGKGIAFSARFRWENELHILVSRNGRNHT